MMSEESPEIRQFKMRLKEALQRDPLQAVTRTIAKHGHVYTCGDHDGMECSITALWLSIGASWCVRRSLRWLC